MPKHLMDCYLSFRRSITMERIIAYVYLAPCKFSAAAHTTMQDQWKKKKQTKEEAAAARRAKLDPSAVKSAKDVMDERARKRKAEEVDDSDIEGVEKELPKQGLKDGEKKNNKKQKTKTDSNTPAKSESVPATEQSQEDIEAAKKAKNEQKKLKQQQKKEKAVKKAEKKKEKKEKVADSKIDLGDEDDKIEIEGMADADDQDDDAEENETGADQVEKIEIDGLLDDEQVQRSSASASPNPPSPSFDNPADPSTNTSTSSTIPPATAPRHIKMPTDPELLKARLTARIEALRAARKADGPNGAPARNRQELMEARRKKEEQRRAHKKELRMQARAEDEARREEALASSRDSPASSMMSPALHTASENNFSFGRVAFADGQQLTDDLSSLLTAPRKRGPQDPATALQAAERKRLRLAGLDDEKRADIEEKDLWLAAKKRAHGEKVRDDGNLLKKTLKRKEKAKKKSEKEWGDRKEGVARGMAMKQKKREENLQKRKDSKGVKGGKKAGGAKKGGKPKSKSRPGFEGSFGSSGKKK
jgi:hypothetical protein